MMKGEKGGEGSMEKGEGEEGALRIRSRFLLMRNG
jgi:hypothetical protein